MPDSKRSSRAVIAYLATAAVFLPCDALWLGTMGPRLYRPTLGHLLAEQPDLAAAALFYVLYLLGIVAFAVRPMDDQGPLAAGARGALFGLIAYATYDLTNQATLKDWPWTLTAIDLAWGSLLSAAAAAAACAVVRRIGRK